MKLHLSISIALSIFGAALSSPLDEFQNAYHDIVGAQEFRPYSANVKAQGDTTEDLKQPNAEYHFADMQDDSMPENGDIKQVLDQAQSLRNDEEVEMQSAASTNLDVIPHGAEVALQPLYQKLMWLGCAGNPCVKANCPRLFMEGNDWNTCWGEVFQIYRASGPGSVKVGDAVGFYYPRGGTWFSMYKGQGHKDECPGTSSTKFGFSTQDKWKECPGEVFQIYAKGKCAGEVIENHDYITIYYNMDKKWVALVENHPTLATCPGETHPPSADKYDTCWGEVFELWRR